jgi:peptidoglycan/LPS O-acetylase OafA/YrhL
MAGGRSGYPRRVPTAPSPADAGRGSGGWAYQPALDGVRALAVSAVLVFHARPQWLPGGFLGVDAFFVLSGFLITGLLLAEHRRTGRIRLVPFWGRRARRLLPALLVVLVAVAGLGRIILPAPEVAALRQDAFAALGYVANWRMIYRGGDYFTATAPASLLQHTWSLGIEEQFYLVWPLLVLLALATRRPRAAVLAVAVAGIAASTWVSETLYRPGADPGRVYYGTDARASALLVGCALAAALAGRDLGSGRRRLLALGAVPATTAVAWAWARADGGAGWLYRGGLTLLAGAVAAGLAYLVAAPRGWGARVLSVPPLVWLGRISYGVYLWHWPLFGLLTADRTGLPADALTAVRLAAAVLVAAVTFYLVELPVRRAFPGRAERPADQPQPDAPRPDQPRRRRQRRRIPATAKALAATGAAFGVAVAAVAVATAVPPVPAGIAEEAPPLAPGGAQAAPSGSPAGRLPPGMAPTARPGRQPGPLPRVTILGDSVAWTLGAYLPEHPGLAVGNRALPGCGISRLPDIWYGGGAHTNYPGCDRWDQRWQAAVNGDDPDLAVILLDRWELMDRRLNGRYQHVGDSQFDAYLQTELSLAITIAASRGARVVLLTAPYTRRLERPDGGLWPEDTPARVDAWNRLLARTAGQHPAAPRILDLNPVICPGGQFTWRISGVRVRSDGLHFTPTGVRRFIAPWLLPQLTELATTP